MKKYGKYFSLAIMEYLYWGIMRNELGKIRARALLEDIKCYNRQQPWHGKNITSTGSISLKPQLSEVNKL